DVGLDQYDPPVPHRLLAVYVPDNQGSCQVDPETGNEGPVLAPVPDGHGSPSHADQDQCRRCPEMVLVPKGRLEGHEKHQGPANPYPPRGVGPWTRSMLEEEQALATSPRSQADSQSPASAADHESTVTPSGAKPFQREPQQSQYCQDSHANCLR